MKYIIDVPTLNGEWDEIASFDTREEATEFIRVQWGGDENGMVALITEDDFEDRVRDDDCISNDLNGKPMTMDNEQ